MTTVIREPAFRIWIEGHPLSSQGDRRHLTQYSERIRNAALEIVPFPIKSTRIDIEIYFRYKRALSPDIDNVIKPILDCLKDVVYFDDSQVRSIKVAALPVREAYGISGWTNIEVMKRLWKTEPEEFLIEIFEGLSMFTGPS